MWPWPHHRPLVTVDWRLWTNHKESSLAFLPQLCINSDLSKCALRIKGKTKLWNNHQDLALTFWGSHSRCCVLNDVRWILNSSDVPKVCLRNIDRGCSVKALRISYQFAPRCHIDNCVKPLVRKASWKLTACFNFTQVGKKSRSWKGLTNPRSRVFTSSHHLLPRFLQTFARWRSNTLPVKIGQPMAETEQPYLHCGRLHPPQKIRLAAAHKGKRFSKSARPLEELKNIFSIGVMMLVLGVQKGSNAQNPSKNTKNCNGNVSGWGQYLRAHRK